MRELGQEIRMMEAVKGYTNIVSIEDYQEIGFPDRMQWYVLIRMELLTPLQRLMQNGSMPEGQILKLGLDLCEALIVCRKKNIVHRDI